MKQFATFISLMAVAWAAALAIKHRLPWNVCAYLVAQSLFALCGWWIAQRVTLSSREYLLFFATFGIVLVFALIVAVSWPMNFWTGVWQIPALALAAAFSIVRILGSLGTSSAQQKLTLVQGGVLLFCGFLTLHALPEPLSPELRCAAIALGMFWTLQGAFAWVHAASGFKYTTANAFLPQMLAIACFAWLAVMLSGSQPESARQHAQDEQITELVWDEAQ